MLRTVYEVTVALLAVWGLYSALRALAELFFVPRAYSVSVRLRPGEEAADLAARITEARLALCGGAELTVTLLCDEDTELSPDVRELLSSHSGQIFYIRPYDGIP